jgi:hypothetical protein
MALDLNMGYYHIELSPFSKCLCTIVTPFGKYEYQHLPMGLCGLQPMVTCMCCNGSERMELLGTVVSSPVLRKVGTMHYVVEWARENGCPEP